MAKNNFMSKTKKDRNKEIIELCEKGELTKAEIARRYDITHCRVTQIYKQYLFKQSLKK